MTATQTTDDETEDWIVIDRENDIRSTAATAAEDD